MKFEIQRLDDTGKIVFSGEVEKAEIEALREDAERWKRAAVSNMQAWNGEMERACTAEAQAERLAEALREERDLFRDETAGLVRQNGEWKARAEQLEEALREARHYIDGNRAPGIAAKIDAALDAGGDRG